MKEVTETQFKINFDTIMAEVESGETYIITADTGNRVALMPYKSYMAFSEILEQMDQMKKFAEENTPPELLEPQLPIEEPVVETE